MNTTIDLIEFTKEVQIPKFPIKAEYLMKELNLAEGKELGQALKKIENYWLENSFNIDIKNIKKIFKF